MRQTAQTSTKDIKGNMPQISYADLHCDSVTACCKSGSEMSRFGGQVSVEKLGHAGCSLQCFALFTEGENSAGDLERFLAFYNAQIAIDPRILPVERYSDVEKAEREGKIAALLTVENMGFAGGDAGAAAYLKKAGVKMASLVWNTPNAFAFPNLVMRGDAPDFGARCALGLTAAGREAVEALNAQRIIIDLSHISDGGAEEILALSSAPVVASHSNCRGVCDVSRNLTDGLIKKIADGGGAVGLNFCRAFVVEGAAERERRGLPPDGESACEWLLRHYRHLVNAGGEDLPAIGSDFDGIPPYPELCDCLSVQKLFAYFYERGVGVRALEKLARKNFLRVLKEVIG